jgi:hypothetical protein
MSDLEELVIHSAQPSSLGAKVFQSLFQLHGPGTLVTNLD